MKILNMIAKLFGIRQVYWFGGEGKLPSNPLYLAGTTKEEAYNELKDYYHGGYHQLWTLKA